MRNIADLRESRRHRMATARRRTHAPVLALTTRRGVYNLGVYTISPSIMKTARVFMTGNSQVVRLPKEFRINADRVEILRRGKDTILRPIKTTLEEAFNLLAALPDDFMPEGRKDSPPQKRKGL